MKEPERRSQREGAPPAILRNYARSVNGKSSAEQGTTGGPAAKAGASSTAELAIEGMHCSSCVALIEESLVEEDGVLGASVDLDSGRARVTFDPTRLGVDRIRSVIVEAGYAAMPIG